MNKLLAKLLACVLALTVSASLMVMASYAWLTMSGAPEVDGIQVHIGGSNTVLIAPDVTVQAPDGSVSHYPGAFEQTLRFSQNPAYDYVSDLAGLLPVSTADGIHWILPDYYDLTDPQVLSGQAASGQMKALGDFTVDTTLAGANLTELTAQDCGHYVYLDFWVVSPGEDYQLRVSTGDGAEDSGTYVIELPNITKTADTCQLTEDNLSAGASVRLGFLVNSDSARDSDMYSYVASDAYSGRYHRLLGRYAEPGQTAQEAGALTNRFTVFEPNGNLHPADAEDKAYYITEPLTVIDGQIGAANISGQLSVQLQSSWKRQESAEQTLLQQEFATAIAGKDLSGETKDSLWQAFYRDRLQGQMAAYVDRGSFVTDTYGLYSAARSGKVSADSDVLRLTSGATEDVYITALQRDVPQRIRLFLWLEGQDSDCADGASASGLCVNLELAGSNDY